MSTFFLRYPCSPFAACAGAVLMGCAMPAQSLGPAPAPDALQVQMQPAALHDGASAELMIGSPGADSIVFESANGVDRYWTRGPELRVAIASDFGDPAPVARYAVRRDGRLLSLLKKPARIAVCRQGLCREYYHEVPVLLPERNQRSVALTGGWSSVFARRSIFGADRTVLFKEVLNAGVWSVQGEWAPGRWHTRAQAFTGGGEHGGALDVSRMLFGGGELSYGLSMHLGMTHSGWIAEGPNPSGVGRTAYRAAVGPSIMLRGITASSLLGIYSDGVETLQISSTRVSVNGNLTSVRHPVTITAEKTFAFAGGAIVSRRREALERLTAGIRLVDGFALNVGVSSHRMAWPEASPSDDLRASETVITLGGQYTVTW